VCRPRFLKGVIVRAVWCELQKGSGWAKARLLLSTDPTLSAPAIVEAYSGRWSIEPLFRDLKMVDGLGAMSGATHEEWCLDSAASAVTSIFVKQGP
jgi:hypothetical protein